MCRQEPISSFALFIVACHCLIAVQAKALYAQSSHETIGELSYEQQPLLTEEEAFRGVLENLRAAQHSHLANLKAEYEQLYEEIIKGKEGLYEVHTPSRAASKDEPTPLPEPPGFFNRLFGWQQVQLDLMRSEVMAAALQIKTTERKIFERDLPRLKTLQLETEMRRNRLWAQVDALQTTLAKIHVDDSSRYLSDDTRKAQIAVGAVEGLVDYWLMRKKTYPWIRRSIEKDLTNYRRAQALPTLSTQVIANSVANNSGSIASGVMVIEQEWLNTYGPLAKLNALSRYYQFRNHVAQGVMRAYAEISEAATPLANKLGSSEFTVALAKLGENIIAENLQPLMAEATQSPLIREVVEEVANESSLRTWVAKLALTEGAQDKIIQVNELAGKELRRFAGVTSNQVNRLELLSSSAMNHDKSLAAMLNVPEIRELADDSRFAQRFNMACSKFEDSLDDIKNVAGRMSSDIQPELSKINEILGWLQRVPNRSASRLMRVLGVVFRYTPKAFVVTVELALAVDSFVRIFGNAAVLITDDQSSDSFLNRFAQFYQEYNRDNNGYLSHYWNPLELWGLKKAQANLRELDIIAMRLDELKSKLDALPESANNPITLPAPFDPQSVFE